MAEIGDVTRFTSPAHLASWCSLTTKHHESDLTVHRSPITKQGSRLVRWAAVEAAQRQANGTKLRADFARITAKHGAARKIARVAVARKIVTLVFRSPRPTGPSVRVLLFCKGGYSEPLKELAVTDERIELVDVAAEMGA